MNIKTVSLSFGILGLCFGNFALAQNITIDAGCETGTVDGIPGYIDVSEEGLTIWDNDTDDFLAAIDLAKFPQCQQVAGGDTKPPEPAPAPAGGDTKPPQPAPAPTGGNAKDAFLTAHNKHRAKKNLPPLKWADDVATIAQEWAKKLATDDCGTIAHRPKTYLGPRNLGENLSTASASPNPPARGPASAVDSWAGEEKFYNYENNTCADGEQCGHYTQVVWAKTTEVGCGEATCEKDEWKTKVWACNYRPAGNVGGQKPY